MAHSKHIIRKSVIVGLSFAVGVVSTVFAAATYDANIQNRANTLFTTIKSNASKMDPSTVPSYYTLVRTNIASLIQVLTTLDSSIAGELGLLSLPGSELDGLLGSITGTGNTATTNNNTGTGYYIRNTTDGGLGCKTPGLLDPANKCILQLGSMFVAPLATEVSAKMPNGSICDSMGACGICKNMNIAGKTWHLPTMNELLVIRANKDKLEQVKLNGYWTSDFSRFLTPDNAFWKAANINNENQTEFSHAISLNTLCVSSNVLLPTTASTTTASTNNTNTGTTTNLSLEDAANTGISQDICGTKYEPVCGFMQVPSIGTATKEIKITFTNICYANYRKATGVTNGACSMTPATGVVVTGNTNTYVKQNSSGNYDVAYNVAKIYMQQEEGLQVPEYVNATEELARRQCSDRFENTRGEITMRCTWRGFEFFSHQGGTKNTKNIKGSMSEVGLVPEQATNNRDYFFAYTNDNINPINSLSIITESDAKARCNSMKSDYVTSKFTCTWRGATFYEFDPKKVTNTGSTSTGGITATQVPVVTAYSKEKIKSKNFAIQTNPTFGYITGIAVYNDKGELLETIQYQIGTLRDALKKYNFDRQQLADLDNSLRASEQVKTGKIKNITVPEYDRYGKLIHESNLTNLTMWLAPDEENRQVSREFAISSMYQRIFPDDIVAYNSNIRTYWKNSALSLDEIEQLLLKNKTDLAAAKNPTQKNLIDRTQKITNLYRSVLGKEPDSEGLKYWVDRGLTIDEIRAHFEGLVNPTQGTTTVSTGSTSTTGGIISDTENLIKKGIDPARLTQGKTRGGTIRSWIQYTPGEYGQAGWYDTEAEAIKAQSQYGGWVMYSSIPEGFDFDAIYKDGKPEGASYVVETTGNRAIQKYQLNPAPLVGRHFIISSFYTNILGRNADENGLNYWVNSGKSLTDIEEHFKQVKADEVAKDQLEKTQVQQTNIALELRKNQIIGLYSSILGRSTPDAAGLNYWINDPMSIDQISETFKQIKIKNAAAAAEQEEISQEQQNIQTQNQPIINNNIHTVTSLDDVIRGMYTNNPTAMKHNPNGPDQAAIEYWKGIIADKGISAVQNTIFPNLVKEVDNNNQ